MSVAAPRLSIGHAIEHCRALAACIDRLEEDHLTLLARWANVLAELLPAGGRLLAAGNGGSAAQAQHLTAELVGRYDGERPGYSAIALTAETSSLTAIGNDYGYEEVFARQVQAHGRPGDVLVLMSTSGRSANLLRAAEAGHAGGLRVWTMTGRRPNPLADAADETLDIEAPRTATVQEAHLLALHLLCELFDEARAERAALQTNGSARVRRVNGSALVNGSDGVDGVDRVDRVDRVDGSDRRDGTDQEWIRR